ncbi:hypothetical protein EG329_005366 [Mollisiaceae sp. DMI_Dod_QoI]|nr:hypothetical protein EG329_005366 [Helotiales sp. DMI_Dod_QoI]
MAMDNQRFNAYKRLEEEVRVVEARREQEDRDLSAKFDQEQAKLELLKETKIRGVQDDALAALKDFKDEKAAETATLKARHEKELKELQERHRKELEAITKDEDGAIRSLEEKNRLALQNIADVFKSKADELISKNKRDKSDLKILRDAEDARKKNELFQVVREQSHFAEDSTRQQALQAPQPAVLSGRPGANSPEYRAGPEWEAGRSRVSPPRRTREISPWRQRDRSPRHRARSPIRYRAERHNSDTWRPSYYGSSPEYDDLVHYPPPMYPYPRPPSPRRDYFNDRLPVRSRSPSQTTRSSYTGPPSGPRNWNNGSKRGRADRTPSPPSTTNQDLPPSIPTGPRADSFRNKRARQDNSNQQAPPIRSAGTDNKASGARNANKTPVQPRKTSGGAAPTNSTNAAPHPNLPNKPPIGNPTVASQSKPQPALAAKDGPSATSSNAITTPQKLQANRTKPDQQKETNIKPVGRFVATQPSLSSTSASQSLTHFPVQRVKYTNSSGHLYEWTASSPPLPPKSGELRLVGQTYKGFVPKKDIGFPAGWSILPNTIARVQYWKSHAVIKVTKLKGEDVGPPELWVEFRGGAMIGKREVLNAWLKSFKDGWLLNKCYPEEMGEVDVNPMDEVRAGSAKKG